MDVSAHSSGFGPAVFFGLSAYVLVTTTPIEPQFPNPADMMPIEEVTQGASLPMTFAPFPDQTPPEPRPRAPARMTLPALGVDLAEEPVLRARRSAREPTMLTVVLKPFRFPEVDRPAEEFAGGFAAQDLPIERAAVQVVGQPAPDTGVTRRITAPQMPDD